MQQLHIIEQFNIRMVQPQKREAMLMLHLF